MTIRASGALPASEINTELGLSSIAQISLGGAVPRGLAGVASGAIRLAADYYGKSNSVTAALTISANQTNYTLNPAAVAGYSAGKTTVNFVINSGVYIYSTSTGTPALTITGFASGDVINITNNGFILGMGGRGGNNSAVGSAGGNAISLGFNITLVNNNTLGGGGGGGGSGGTGIFQYGGLYGGCGGGGRTGLTNSAGGNDGTNSGVGSVGTVNGGGAGGAGAPVPFGGGKPGGTGGTGGTWGATGATGATANTVGWAGGAGGKAIALNGYTATRSGSGTTYGAVS